MLARLSALSTVALMVAWCAAHTGCAAFKQNAPLVAEGQIACADAGFSLGASVRDAVHDGGKSFETIVSALVNGIADAACVYRYVRAHLQEHQCADGGQCAAVAAMPADEEKRATALLKLASQRR